MHYGIHALFRSLELFHGSLPPTYRPYTVLATYFLIQNGWGPPFFTGTVMRHRFADFCWNSIEKPSWVHKGTYKLLLILLIYMSCIYMYTLLQSETVNLVKICVHIGEWYRYRDKNASHRMEKRYSLEPLRKDLNTMQLLPSVTLIYANHPKTVSFTTYDVSNLSVLYLYFFALSFFVEVWF